MKTGWKTATVDEICNVEYGKRVVRKNDAGTKYPVYGGGGETFRVDIYNREDRVVVARFGLSEKCTRRVDGRFFLNDSGLTLSPRNTSNLLPEFLDLWTLASNNLIYDLSRGTAQRNLDVDAFRQVLIRYPSELSEQRRIVAILGEAFEGIAAAKANAEQNLRNAKEVFASIAAAAINQQAPEWHDTVLGKLAVVDWGNTDLTKKAYIAEGKYLAVSAAGCDGRIGHAEHRAFTPVLSAIGAQCGRMFMPEEDFTAIKNTITLTPNLDICDGWFLFHLLRTKTLPKRGAAQPFIAKGDVIGFPVSVPSAGEQRVIAARLRNVQKYATVLEKNASTKLASLDELKASLLHQAFTGQL